MTPTQAKFKAAAARAFAELDDEALGQALYMLTFAGERLFQETEYRRMKAVQAAAAAAIATPRHRPRKVKLVGNVVELRPTRDDEHRNA